MSSTPTAVPCREVFDENSQPSAEEISEYAQQIGIDPVSESYLLPLARDGLMHALPAPWKAYYDDKLKTHYFYNSETHVTQWDHPLDRLYKNLVVKAKLSSERGDSILEDTCVSIQDLLTFEEDAKQISIDKCDAKDEMSHNGDSSIDTSLEEEGSSRNFNIPPDKVNRMSSARPPKRAALTPFERKPLPALKARHDLTGRGQSNTFPRTAQSGVSVSNAVTGQRASFYDNNLGMEDSESDSGEMKNRGRGSSLVRRSSDLIDLSFSPGGDRTASLERNIVYNYEKPLAKRGIVLSGGGSIFLKSNRNVQSKDNVKMDRNNSLGNDTSDAPKGILRERSFCDSITKPPVPEKNEEKNNNDHPVPDDDKKSVRFNLDQKDVDNHYDMSPNLSQSNSLSDVPQTKGGGGRVMKTDNIKSDVFATSASAARRNSDNSIGNSDTSKFIRSVKLKPLYSDDNNKIKTLQQLSNKDNNVSSVKPEEVIQKTESVSSVTNSPTRKLIRPHPGDFIKPALFQKPFEKLSDILKASSPDTDSESDFIANNMNSASLTNSKTKISINLMESIESETSIGSPDRDVAVVDKFSSLNKPYKPSKNVVKEKSVETNRVDVAKKKSIVRMSSVGEHDSDSDFSKGIKKYSPPVISDDAKIKMDARLESARVNMEKEFDSQLSSLRRRLEEEHFKNKAALQKAIEDAKENNKIDMAKAMEESMLEFAGEKRKAVENERQKLFCELDEVKEKLLKDHNLQIESLQRDHKSKLEIMSATLRHEYEKSFKEAETCHAEELEKEKKKMAIENRLALEKMKAEHESACDELRKDYRSEIELVRSQQAAHLSALRERLRRERESPAVPPPGPATPPPHRDAAYERLRCDKRLLEDKYRCLKEKYARLKSEVKISIERRNKRREQSLTTGSETEKSHSHRAAALAAQKAEAGEGNKSESSNIGGKRIGTVDGAVSSASREDPSHSLKRTLDNNNANFIQIMYNRDGNRSLSESSNRNDSALNSNLLCVAAKVENCISPDRSRGKSPNERNKSGEGDDNSLSRSDSRNVSNGKLIKRVQVIDRKDDKRLKECADLRNKYPPGRGNAEQSCAETTVTDYQDSSDTATSERRYLKESMNGRSRKKLFTRLKSASTSRLNYTNTSKWKERSCSPVENLRRQLRKLEDLEEQFPDITINADTTAYRLRYPFPDSGAVSGGELGFLRHRALVEREGVRRAKDNLRTRSHLLRQRKRDPKAWQDECELTDMEVSLHRTKSILGEKVIRLRHIEKTLRRIEGGKDDEATAEPADAQTLSPRPHRTQTKERTLSDISSHSSGFSSTEGQSSPPQSHIVTTLNTLQSLNTEIRDIWQVLNSQQQMNVAKVFPIGQLLYADAGWQLPIASTDIPTLANLDSVCRPPLGFLTPNERWSRPLDYPQPVVSRLPPPIPARPAATGRGSTATGLVERTRDLRDWLKQQAAL